MTRLGFVLLYTRDVPAKLAFYERAFGLARQHLTEDGSYGELAGAIPICVVQEDFGAKQGTDFVPARPAERPAAFEIGLIADDVDAAYRRAVAAGATALHPPVTKPWGQTVAYVRDDDGVLIEIATPWSH